RWWRFLGRPQTHRFLLVAGLAGAVILSLVGSAAIYDGWLEDRRIDRAAGEFLVAHTAPGDIVMSDDPSAVWQVSGRAGVPMPFDPYPVVEDVIRAYDVRWVVVARRDGAAMDPLGLWEGAEATDGTGHAATFLESDPIFETSGVRIYRVVGSAR
ncbi:MAG TPA: hypothetical protein VFM19_03605, partial [Candidatus Limnocylindria bacterium]|nr:hypothetical protein [Candidatus Limnocylindria bacterium]